ncbi:uncharacterized protein LOC103572416 [Microplitis demolitor]|uniref:uncharacterized protein LOC103572416 n=1 Tax=Microplitis demolitor TaxID=69319 RepID=UPI0004CDBC77|nr:uncharacterized protein LOC103572416 [Microplitis demolitor]
MDVFEIESKILKCVLPQIELIVGKKIGPKYFYESKEHSEIFMEDLSKFGFKTKNRILGFTKDHMLMAIETLAKYHAGSIALDEKQPGSLHRYRQSLLGEYTHPNFLNMIKYSLEYLGNAMHNWSDEKCRKIAPKIEKLSKSVIENLKNNINYAKDEFCVLNHGDCWISNIMFLENDLNEPLEVRLVDYQVPVWTSPALDLQYFLSICPEFNIKYIFDDFFIEKYLHTLKETMEKIGSKRKPPTFYELKLSMMKRRSLALAGGLVFYPKIIVDTDDIGTIKNVLDNQAWNTKIYDNPKIIDKLVKLIPLIDTQGYLD